jgi:hypothetical protein
MHARVAALAAFALATAACAGAADSPTAPVSRRASNLESLGPPPPPPLDTQSVSLTGSVGERTIFFYDAEKPLESYQPGARYFLNRAETIAWLQFSTSLNVVASPDARLLFNKKAGTTQGNGTLTDRESGNLLLDLSRVTIDPESSLGPCLPEKDNYCGFVTFTAGAGVSGRLQVQGLVKR